jgi:predicted PurR-regulated permease PerM
MPSYQLSFQRLAYFLICVTILTYFLIVARGLLAPFVFAMLFAFVLKPISDWFEGFMRRIPAILCSMIIVALPLLAIISLFGIQLGNIFYETRDIISGLLESVNDLVAQIDRGIGGQLIREEGLLSENLTALIRNSLGIVTGGISTSGVFIADTVLVLIYTFLLLLYRSALRDFFLSQLSRKTRKKGAQLIDQIQHVSQDYLLGLLIVMLILALLNSLGLLLIGIDYAFFWGVLGAFLAIIPYVGTTLGGILPFLFAIATTDTLWQPIAVAIMYMSIQSIEGNFITPKVVGSSVNINPFAAILGLVIGGSLWGVAGLILALPILAIIKIALQTIDQTQPLSLLLSEHLYRQSHLFEERYDKPKYRLSNLFRSEDSAAEEE